MWEQAVEMVVQQKKAKEAEVDVAKAEASDLERKVLNESEWFARHDVFGRIARWNSSKLRLNNLRAEVEERERELQACDAAAREVMQTLAGKLVAAAAEEAVEEAEDKKESGVEAPTGNVDKGK